MFLKIEYNKLKTTKFIKVEIKPEKINLKI